MKDETTNTMKPVLSANTDLHKLPVHINNLRALYADIRCVSRFTETGCTCMTAIGLI